MSASSEQLPAHPAPRPWPLAPEPEPVFGLLEVFLAFLLMLLALLFCGAIAIVIAHHVAPLSHIRTADLATNPLVIVPAQLAAYLLLFAALSRLFRRHHHIGFFRALRWRWPLRWPMYLIAGLLLALAVQLLAHFLPAPPELPIDKMLRTPLDAWLMSAFAVLVAPFAEEVLFRGLLFPALARRAGALISLLATSVLFGAIHAGQLGGAWAQVACIILVGAVLTAVRWRFHSLASSTLVHVGYNGALFVALFMQTRGFTNFSLPLR
ncbi:MAG: CPBP family intramembrane glutamic endopeptidase [Terracidiphilus sp.]